MTKILKPVCLMVVLALVLSLGAMVLPAREARAADTGWRSPTANAVGGGGGFTDPTRAYGDDTYSALCYNGQSQLYYNYGFSIPGEATIDGIAVRIDANAYPQVGTVGRLGVALSWDEGTNWTTTIYTPNLPFAQSTSILGGATNTWGRSWAPSDFSNTNFRIRVYSETNYQFNALDWCPVIVYYHTTAPPLVTTNDATAVTDTSATLNGNLTSLGTASTVNVSFEWGETSGVYDYETTPEPMTSTGPFSFNLPGLSPDTPYYFRAKADGDGVEVGLEKDFTTTSKTGDVNGDGRVSLADMVLVAQHWGETGTPGWIPEDVNQDGRISLADLVLVAQNWTG